MKWPKEFERVSGQKVRLTGTKIYIYQWNTGKNKILWLSMSVFPFINKAHGQFQEKATKP